MFRLLTAIPKKINLAFSGGVDSLAVAHFLKRGKHDVTLLHFNHGCQYSNKIEEECRERAEQLELPIIVGMNDREYTKGSLEDFWRRSRYKWLRGFNEKFITCHHLNDAMESAIISMLNTGEVKLIPVEDKHVLRPFLITKKSDFVSYADRHCLIPVADEYNVDMSKQRNYIRFNTMPHILHTHPGFDTVIGKKYLRDINVSRPYLLK